jgi:hypothetical protein
VQKGDIVSLHNNCDDKSVQLDEHIYLTGGTTFRNHIFDKDETDPLVTFMVLKTYYDLSYKVCFRKGGALSKFGSVEQVGLTMGVRYFPCLQQETFVWNSGTSQGTPHDFDVDLTATQGKAPYTFAITNGAKLPSGLKFDTALGKITGQIKPDSWFTPDADDGLDLKGNPMPKKFDFLVTDADGIRAFRQVNISAFDTTPPYASFSAEGFSAAALQHEAFTVRITLSEICVKGLSKAGILVTNGAIVKMSEVATPAKKFDRHQYSIDIKPGASDISPGSGNHDITISLVPGTATCVDRYGNGLSASQTPLVISYQAPTMAPTLNPTVNPTTNPTINPTTRNPTKEGDTWAPTKNPNTNHPTINPTRNPTTVKPTANPNTVNPTENPTFNPTLEPTAPTMPPTVEVAPDVVRVSVTMNINYHSLMDPKAFEEATFDAIVTALQNGEARRHANEYASHLNDLALAANATDSPTAAAAPATGAPTLAVADSNATTAPTGAPTAPTESPTSSPTFAPTYSPTVDFGMTMSVVQLLPGSTVLAIDVTGEARMRVAQDIETYVTTEDAWWREAMMKATVEQFSADTTVEVELLTNTPAPTSSGDAAMSALNEGTADAAAALPVIMVMVPIVLIIMAAVVFRKKIKAKLAQRKKDKGRKNDRRAFYANSRRISVSKSGFSSRSRSGTRRSSRSPRDGRRVGIFDQIDVDLEGSPRTGRTPGRPGRRSTRSVQVRPALPGGKPMLPGGKPSLPGGKPSIPGGKPSIPGGKPSLPGGKPSLPGGKPSIPAAIPAAKPGTSHGRLVGGRPALPGGRPAIPGGKPELPGGKPSMFPKIISI